MRGSRIAVCFGLGLIPEGGCSETGAGPVIEWPPATEIAQDKMDGLGVVLERGLVLCSNLSGAIPMEFSRVLYQRDECRPGPPIPAVDFGPGAEVVAYTRGSGTRCAVLASGEVKCWGRNTFFQLGLEVDDPHQIIGDDESERGEDMPSIALGSGLRAVQVVGGGGVSCARFRDDRVKCWGLGTAQLGLGDTDIRGDAPGEMGDALPFVDLGTGVRAVGLAASPAHSCIWTEDGRVKCWGENARGQLGIESVGGEPVGDDPGEMGDALPFVDLGRDVRVVQVSPALEHTCALTDDGRIKCWGGNFTVLERDPHIILPPELYEPHDFGRLGTEDREDRRAPLGDGLATVDLGADFRAVAVAAREFSTCAVSDEGRLKCWGGHASLRLADVDQDLGDDPGEMGDALPYVDLGDGRTVRMIDTSPVNCLVLDDYRGVCWSLSNLGLTGDAIVPWATPEDLIGPG